MDDGNIAIVWGGKKVMHPMPPALVPFATRKIAEKQRKE
jgi:hypothetical protein